MTTKIITFNPWLYGYLGHSLIYTQSIEKAVSLNNWQFLAALPKKCIVQDLPKHWEKSIGCPTVRHWFEAIEGKAYRRPKKRIRAKQRIYYYKTVAEWLFKNLIRDQAEKKVLFLEAFAQTDVALLVNILRFLPKKNISVWLIHRYQSSTLGSDVRRYNKCHQALLKMGIHLKLLTDSELLKSDLEKSFELPFTVLPIPYIENMPDKVSSQSEHIICWWPGIIREGKGLKIIQDFVASSNESNKKIEVVLNEQADIKVHKNSPKVTQLENHLSRDDYIGWMKKSDVILLPYSDPHYEKATSSIFLEAVMAGKIPLVYPNTWMAYELSQFNLQELVIDWDPSLLSETIFNKFQDSLIREKLQKLQAHYKSFHSFQGYAEALKELIS